MMLIKESIKKINIYKISIYIFAFVLVFFALPNIVKDTDYMWHIKLGEYIFENKTIPTTNIFGYFDTLKFFAHEWLFDLIMYLFYLVAGDNGVLVFVFINVCFMIHILYKILSLRVNNCIFNSIVLFTTLVYISSFIVARPQIFSYNLILYLIYILLAHFENLSKKFIHLVFITIFIVNAHAGSYPIIFAILGIYIFGQFIDKVYNYDKNKVVNCEFEYSKKNWIISIYDNYLKNAIDYVKKPIILSILLIPFLLINPYTFDIYMYPFQVMGNDIAMDIILEWSPTKFIDENRYLLLYIMIILTSFRFKNKQNSFTDWIFIIVFVILGATHLRHIALLIFILTIFSSKHLYDLLKFIYNKLFISILSHTSNDSIKDKLNFMIKCLFFVLIISSCITLSTTKPNPTSVKFYPYEILQYIKDTNINLEKNVMFNDYNLGGFLIRNDIKVFIDGRADVYSKSVNKKEEVLGLYFQISSGLNWKYNFEKYNIKYVLINKARPLGHIIQNNSSFKILIEEKDYIFAEYNANL